MRPAYSIIVFTTTSGAGLGLLIAFALAVLAGAPPAPAVGLAATLAGLALNGAGFVASAFHLGRPERALRALSQWRSSWLSREAVLAVLCYPVAGGFLYDWLSGGPPARIALAAAATAALAAATIAATAMIYASLKPIPAWRDPRVVPGYLALALATGGAWYAAFGALAGDWEPAAGWIALAGLVAGLAIKRAYWRALDTAAPRFDAGDATGLGGLGRVRLLDAPHTAPNFVMKEMGYRIARKHAARLRRLVVLGGLGLPAALFAVLLAAAPTGGPIAAGPTVAAALAASLGALIERWLFFAEAKHYVTLYYGGDMAREPRNS